MTLEKQELDRIETAKSAIGTAIAGKGVAVPSGTKLDGMAALIEDIEQGSDPVLQSKSVTPSETAQTVKPDSGYDGLSQVSVGAISKTYVGSSVPKQAAQTITPGTSNKTIASGRYLTGTQTIKGDANLVAGNIAKDVTIFGVTGTHEGGEDVSAETAEYTELLTDLETAIDALPDAGSGGDLQVATGTQRLTYNASHSNGSTILEVTGLPFTPKHVCVSRSGNVSFQNATNVLFMCEGGLYDLTMKVRSTTGMAIEVNKESVEIVMIENGFRVIAKTSNIINAGGEHAYYAIG